MTAIDNRDDEIGRLRKSLNFLTSHLPGASELADLAENRSLTLETNHAKDPVAELVGDDAAGNQANRAQQALDEFKTRRLTSLEVGRLYERYIGYLYEKDGWHVTFKGIFDGFDDLGRDLVCIKDDEHHIVQAKCWSRNSQIHEKHIYQLHSSTLHYRMQLRRALRERYGLQETRRRMQPISKNLKSVLCTTTELSETAKEVVDHLGKSMLHRLEPLVKDYPMIKCNIGMHDERKLYHLPFDPAYDTIIIGNVPGESYAETVAEAEKLGFTRVGT